MEQYDELNQNSHKKSCGTRFNKNYVCFSFLTFVCCQDFFFSDCSKEIIPSSLLSQHNRLFFISIEGTMCGKKCFNDTFMIYFDCCSAGKAGCPITEGLEVSIPLPPSIALCTWSRHWTLNCSNGVGTKVQSILPQYGYYAFCFWPLLSFICLCSSLLYSRPIFLKQQSSTKITSKNSLKWTLRADNGDIGNCYNN